MQTDKRIVKVDNWIYYEIWTDDEPNLKQIKRQQGHYNDTEGQLYSTMFPEDLTIIGRWWNVNIEAEKWKEIAGKLQWWLSTYIEAYPEHKEHQVYSILKQYEQLIQEENGRV